MPSSKIFETNYEACVSRAVEFVLLHAVKSEVLIVGATQEAAGEVVRRACTASLVGVHAITLRNLARVLAESRLHASGLTEINAIAREAVVMKVTAATKLDYFAPVSGMPGFPKALSRSIRELRMERATPDGDLASLLQAYDAELQHRSLADAATVFTSALAVVRDGSHPLRGLPVVFLDAPSDHAAERALVDALVAAAADSLVISLDPDFHPPRVDIFSASTEAMECVEIARRAGQLAEQGVPFDRMAVLARDAPRLQPLLEEAFERAALPVWFAGGFVRPSVPGRAFLALLRCAREGLSATRFLEYLSLGQTRGGRSHRWERIILDSAIIGGIDRWKRRLEALTHQEDDADFCRTAQVLSLFALPILEMLAALPRQASWTEWLEHLPLLADTAIFDRRPLLEFLEQLAPLAGIGDHPATLQDVIDLLSGHLTHLRQGPEGSRYGRVFAGSIEDARGMSFDVVFLPGLCEGGFPRILREDPLLLNDHRRRLGMSVADESGERRLLRQAAGSAQAKLVVSYARIDLSTGRARVPSLYAYDCVRAGTGELFDPRQLQQRAEAGSCTTLAWPAPANYKDAIDDTEYDLSVLREPFESEPAQHGAAAYLNKVSPLAVHVLRSRWRRWHGNWHSTDGVFDDIEAQILLRNHCLTRRAYSATALQHFSACPYRFYLRSILRLRPFDPPVAAQRMEPRTRGAIFHQVQAATLRQLRFPSIPDDALGILELNLDRVASEMAEALPPAIPHVWREEMARLRADLRGWLAEVLQQQDEWTPAAIELGFGHHPGSDYDAKSSDGPAVVFGEFLLSGSIDVVERHANGLNHRVLDHKTGSVPKETPITIGRGEVLQPVLYALAAEQLLGESVPRGHLFYATLRGNYRKVNIPVNDISKERARQLLSHINTAIDNGEFHACPRKDACAMCDYTDLCGPYEEERAARKPRLRALEAIRNTK